MWKVDDKKFLYNAIAPHIVDGKVTGAKVKGKDGSKGYPLSDYEWAMADLYADLLGVKKTKR